VASCSHSEFFHNKIILCALQGLWSIGTLRLPFFAEQQWLDDILGVRKLEHIELYFQYAYVKSAVWAYEREWRVWDLRPQPSPLHYYDYPLWDKEVEAVYFGCNIASESKVDIMSLLSMKYPEAKLFQARKGCDKYRLEFNAI